MRENERERERDRERMRENEREREIQERETERTLGPLAGSKKRLQGLGSSAESAGTRINLSVKEHESITTPISEGTRINHDTYQ
jgi:hypothetical protein